MNSILSFFLLWRVRLFFLTVWVVMIIILWLHSRSDTDGGDEFFFDFFFFFEEKVSTFEPFFLFHLFFVIILHSLVYDWFSSTSTSSASHTDWIRLCNTYAVKFNSTEQQINNNKNKRTSNNIALSINTQTRHNKKIIINFVSLDFII